MTLDFIEKRIKEQDDELDWISFRFMKGEITKDRWSLLWHSASIQHDYFVSEKQKLIATSK